MSDHKSSVEQYVQAISESGLSIYDYIEVGDRNLWIPTPDLEILIDDEGHPALMSATSILGIRGKLA